MISKFSHKIQNLDAKINSILTELEDLALDEGGDILTSNLKYQLQIYEKEIRFLRHLHKLSLRRPDTEITVLSLKHQIYSVTTTQQYPGLWKGRGGEILCPPAPADCDFTSAISLATRTPCTDTTLINDSNSQRSSISLSDADK